MIGNIAWFGDLSRTDIPSVGGKGANLGEMIAGWLPRPGRVRRDRPGYLDAMDEAGVRDDLFRWAVGASTSVTPRPLSAPREDLGAHPIRRYAIRLREELAETYHRLVRRRCVAVRSSATDEDTAGCPSPA